MQIRTRLTLQFMLIVAGIMLAAMAYIYFQYKNHLRNEFYGSLRAKASLTAGMALGRSDPAEPLSESATFLTAYTENISIYNPENIRVYSFNPAPDDIPPATLQQIRRDGECRFPHGKYSALGTTYAHRSGRSYVVVAESVFNPADLENLCRILLWVFFLLAALVSVCGWVFAGQALAPVSHIMNQVDDILPADLSNRLSPTNQHDEMSRLADTFNRMLDRIQQAFQAQKMFLSNISHELKNPLTVIISQIEVILDKERSREEYRHTLASVLDDAKELSEVSNKLMQLAKINAGGSGVAFERLRLDEMIWQAKAALLKTNPAYKISFEVVNLPEDEEKLYVQGNEQLLKTALVNLMDNGCKFSPDRNVKVRLSFTPSGAMAVEIQDRGPGIEAAEMPQVFQPFYRSPKTASVKGSGIGLSLVDSIVKLHQIELRVDSSQPSGTTFRLEFPLN